MLINVGQARKRLVNLIGCVIQPITIHCFAFLTPATHYTYKNVKYAILVASTSSKYLTMGSLAATAWLVHHQQCLQLHRQMSSIFWTACTDVEQSHLRRLVQTFNQLLGRCQVPCPTDLEVNQFHPYFNRPSLPNPPCSKPFHIMSQH